VRVSAVLVTKGDRDVSKVVDTLTHFDEVIVWDNSKACKDVKVYGRFVGAMMARNDIVYVQDDDCIVSPAAIAGQFLFGDIVCNVPQERRPEYAGTGITLIGWGCVFGKSKLASFRSYLEVYPQDELFERECDRIFTWLNRSSMRLVDTGLEHLPEAFNDNRMGREHRHRRDYDAIRARLCTLDAYAREARRCTGVEIV